MAEPAAQRRPHDHAIPDVLRWNRPIFWDPVPEWLVDRLHIDVLSELLLVDIQFERDVLKQRLESLERKTEILQRGLKQ